MRQIASNCVLFTTQLESIDYGTHWWSPVCVEIENENGNEHYWGEEHLKVCWWTYLQILLYRKLSFQLGNNASPKSVIGTASDPTVMIEFYTNKTRYNPERTPQNCKETEQADADVKRARWHARCIPHVGMNYLVFRLQPGWSVAIIIQTWSQMENKTARKLFPCNKRDNTWKNRPTFGQNSAENQFESIFEKTFEI